MIVFLINKSKYVSWQENTMDILYIKVTSTNYNHEFYNPNLKHVMIVYWLLFIWHNLNPAHFFHLFR